MNKLIYCSLLLLILIPLAGCSQLDGEKSDSPVIAKIDTAAITQEDFMREVERVPEWARAQFKGQEGKDKFLDELVKRELIYHHAKKMRLDNDKDYRDKVKEFQKMTLVSMVLKKEVEEKAMVDDSAVKKFFDENEEKFTIGTELKASHILVETEDEARQLHSKIKSGESFAELARKHSKDSGSAAKGGDLGYFGKGKMVPEFEMAAAKLKPGEVSEPVRTRFGYHLIQLDDVKKGKPANFEQTKESIKRQLTAEIRKKLFDDYVNKLKVDYPVERVSENLTTLVLPWEEVEKTKPSEAPAAENK